ncbi:hypothetical protein AGJ34_12285 [Cronobacter dublinensis subsp. dublinensis]|nr:hypothetical protein [Cronobacter dublinensis subsp. dublinensis]EGT5669873.1 hypothetical protein [Cronobacter dublinensis subsp. dublinensis]EGT5673774.1 hypothetical protein [Cronobacter dublinensis subsp. dublinensis]EGT5677212.1 hypothetical protein [Cronobacter dublinensis subsp. dublinensis]EGT5686401.1 hypothetical protein [Cronobacter dublinensis subsp. dublinensis]
MWSGAQKTAAFFAVHITKIAAGRPGPGLPPTPHPPVSSPIKKPGVEDGPASRRAHSAVNVVFPRERRVK